MQGGGIGAEKPEEMPEKQEARRKSEEKLVSHLGGKPKSLIGRGLPDEATHDSAGEAEDSHCHAKFTLPPGDCH